MKILFVCTGNTCRSPMAEGILKDMIVKKNISLGEIGGLGEMEVMSAGISVNSRERANEKSIKALKTQNIDISRHQTTQLNQDLIQRSDIILTMTYAHKQIIVNQMVESLGKVYALKEFANKINGKIVENNNLDIADPYGMDYNVYEQCMYEIQTELYKSIDSIVKWRKA